MTKTHPAQDRLPVPVPALVSVDLLVRAVNDALPIRLIEAMIDRMERT